MLLFGWSPVGRQLSNPPGTLINLLLPCQKHQSQLILLLLLLLLLLFHTFSFFISIFLMSSPSSSFSPSFFFFFGFSTGVSNNLSLKSKWQQVSSGLLGSSGYSAQCSSDFYFPNIFSKPLGNIPSAPTTIRITVTLLIHRLLLFRGRGFIVL